MNAIDRKARAALSDLGHRNNTLDRQIQNFAELLISGIVFQKSDNVQDMAVLER